jgi:hypothetical protein
VRILGGGEVITVRLGEHPLDEQIRRQIARLLHLHYRTHPERIARRYGVTDRYVRILWQRYALHELGQMPLGECLQALEEERAALEQSSGQTG